MSAGQSYDFHRYDPPNDYVTVKRPSSDSNTFKEFTLELRRGVGVQGGKQDKKDKRDNTKRQRKRRGGSGGLSDTDRRMRPVDRVLD